MDDSEITNTEITNLLDVRTWAIATLMQVSRVRRAWVDTERTTSQGHLGRTTVEDIDANSYDVLDIDVHFLLIAAYQLIAARNRRLEAHLPKLTTAHIRAIETLRPIREHYGGHRPAFFGDATPSRHATALRRLDPDAHPWTVRGDIAPVVGTNITVAGVLPLDELETEVRAIQVAADTALTAIKNEQRRTTNGG